MEDCLAQARQAFAKACIAEFTPLRRYIALQDTDVRLSRAGLTPGSAEACLALGVTEKFYKEQRFLIQLAMARDHFQRAAQPEKFYAPAMVAWYREQDLDEVEIFLTLAGFSLESELAWQAIGTTRDSFSALKLRCATKPPLPKR